MENTFLAIVDADRIQEYIFTPHRLKLIRGASAIQRDLNLKHALDLLRDSGFGSGNVTIEREITEAGLEANPEQAWEVIYAGGGNLYALFRDDGAACDFTRRACGLYPRHGGSATATAGVVPWRTDFRTTLDAARAEVVKRKKSPGMSRAPNSSPFTKTCEACGAGAATCWSRSKVTGERIYCPACEKRYAQSQRALLLEKVRDNLLPPKDFEVIAADARPENYLALVYIDVDKLGRFFDEFPTLTPAIFRTESLNIRDTVESAVVKGCHAASEATPPNAPAPFEILLLGGDDAVVMLAAQHVFSFLKSFNDEFHAELPELTFSAGVVWAHHHVPIAQFVDHAKKLLRSAKRNGGGRVDYMEFSESMARGVESRDSSRTRRPYLLGDFQSLAATIGEWKRAGFPSSKAHQLYAMAFEERDQGTLDFLYWLSRLKEPHRNLAYQYFRPGFWQDDPSECTGAADLAELWDFVEAE